MPDESKSLDQYNIAVWESYAVSRSLDQYNIAIWESYAVNRSLDQYAFVVWEPNHPVAVCPDIVGSPGVTATFDASASTYYDYIVWTWTSVPGGSSIANAVIPYPDGGAATPIDMTDNEALYHLDGTGDDTSGNALNLTQFNTPTFPAGKVGANCIEFNGTNQYAQATVPTGTAGTIACWLQLTGTPSNSEVFIGLGVNTSSTNGTWRAISWYTGGLSFFGRGGSASDIYGWGGSLTVGQWYHVVITWNASNLVSCYLDGVLITAQTKTLLSPATDLSLGARLNAGTYYADCKLDEVAVWSRALSGMEISQIYAVQSTAVAGTGDTLTFTPDVVGTYTVDVTAVSVYGSDTTSADAVISVAPPPSTGIGNFTGAALGQRGFLGQDFLVPLTAIDPSEDLD